MSIRTHSSSQSPIASSLVKESDIAVTLPRDQAHGDSCSPRSPRRTVMGGALALSLLFGATAPSQAQDAWTPTNTQFGVAGMESGWRPVICSVRSPNKIYADAKTQTVVVASDDTYAVSRDGGMSFSPARGVGQNGQTSRIAEISAVQGQALIRTDDGYVFGENGGMKNKAWRVGSVDRMAATPNGRLYLQSGAHVVGVENDIPTGITSGELALVIGETAMVFNGNKASAFNGSSAVDQDVYGPRPMGWLTRTGPSVDVAYDQNGGRFAMHRNQLRCDSVTPIRVSSQTSSATKDGYYHFTTSGSAGCEIAFLSQRTQDAGPSKANHEAPRLIMAASLGALAQNQARYALCGVDGAQVYNYRSK